MEALLKTIKSERDWVSVLFSQLHWRPTNNFHAGMRCVATAAKFAVFVHEASSLPSPIERRTILKTLHQQTDLYPLLVVLTADGKKAMFVAWRNSGMTPCDNHTFQTCAITIDRELPALALVEQLGRLALPSHELADVHACIESAFDPESFEKHFLQECSWVLQDISKSIAAQLQDQKEADTITHRLFNRLLFLLFLQQKQAEDGDCWLPGGPQFLNSLWSSYLQTRDSRSNFYRDRLLPLFSVLSGRQNAAPSSPHLDFLRHIPPLGIRLFLPRESESRCLIQDEFFSALLITDSTGTSGIFNRYLFIPEEPTAYDTEVAINPGILGRFQEIFPNLVAPKDDVKESRLAKGVFFTPKRVADTLCRLALINTLQERLPDAPQTVLGAWVLAVDPDKQTETDRLVAVHGLASTMYALLCSFTICDPACGNGALLVAMLKLLDNLQARCAALIGQKETGQQRKWRIATEQLYGVDVMEWGIECTEARLWLYVFDAPTDNASCFSSTHFKLRWGDSLVQELPGMSSLPHLSLTKWSPALMMWGERFKEKTQTSAERLLEERQLLQAVCEYLQQQAYTHLTELQVPRQETLFPFADERQHISLFSQNDTLREEWMIENERLRVLEERMKCDQTFVPFVWDVAFAEVFKRGGFDIVIGNPPYVRRKRIAPPTLSPERFGHRWELLRQRYVSRLQQLASGARLSGLTDLYAYFYFLALSILKEGGTLCFVTSDAWLNVRYGRILQRQLVQLASVRWVISSKAEPLFDQADVGAAVTVLTNKRPRSDRDTAPHLQMVSLNCPLSAPTLEEAFRHGIQDSANYDSETLRVTRLSHTDLQLLAGKGWGTFIRRNGVHQLLSKNAHMVPLRMFGTLRLGLTLGNADVFLLRRIDKGHYLTAAFGELQEIALPDVCAVPILHNTGKKYHYEIHAHHLEHYLFVPQRAPNHPDVSAYIEKVERAGLHLRPYLRAKRVWYEFRNIPRGILVFPEVAWEHYFFALNPERHTSTKSFYHFFSEIEPELLFGLFNFSFSFLHFEIMGRKPMAKLSGVSLPIVNELPVVHPDCLSKSQKESLLEIAKHMSKRDVLPISQELQREDRRALDGILLSALGLPLTVADEIYEQLTEMVNTRTRFERRKRSAA